MADEDESKAILEGRRRFVLEIVSCFYFFARFATLPFTQQFMYYLVGKKHNISAKQYDRITQYLDKLENDEINVHNQSKFVEFNSSISKATTILDNLNRESSEFVLYMTFAELLPTVIMLIFFGLSSDVFGKRKFLLWLPCFGNCFYVLGLLLPLYVCDADLNNPITLTCFFTASIISGLSGSSPGFLAGSASYISDVHSTEQRSLKLAIIELIIGMMCGSAALLNGFWISYSNHFEVPLWIIAIISLAVGIMIIIFLPEPYPKHYQVHDDLLNKTKQIFSQGKKMCTLKLGAHTYSIIFAFLIYVFVQQGQERSYVPFLINRPLSWSPAEIGVFLFLLYFLAGIGSWPGIIILRKMLTDQDIFLASLLSTFVGTLVMIITNNMAIIYFSGMVKMLHLLPYAVARSLVSLQVEKEDQGSIYALLHSCLAVTSFIGPLFHIWMFTQTLHFYNGLIFLISALILLPAIMILVILKCREMRLNEYTDMGSVVYDPQLKEDDKGKLGKYNSLPE